MMISAGRARRDRPDTLTRGFLMIGKLPTGEKGFGFQCRCDRPFDRHIVVSLASETHSRSGIFSSPERQPIGIRRLLYAPVSLDCSARRLDLFHGLSPARHSQLTRVKKCPITSATRDGYRLKSSVVRDYCRCKSLKAYDPSRVVLFSSSNACHRNDIQISESNRKLMLRIGLEKYSTVGDNLAINEYYPRH